MKKTWFVHRIATPIHCVDQITLTKCRKGRMRGASLKMIIYILFFPLSPLFDLFLLYLATMTCGSQLVSNTAFYAAQTSLVPIHLFRRDGALIGGARSIPIALIRGTSDSRRLLRLRYARRITCALEERLRYQLRQNLRKIEKSASANRFLL